MKKYRLIIQPPALEDLDAAYQWIHKQAPQAAARWLNGFVEALNSGIRGRNSGQILTWHQGTTRAQNH